LLCTPGGRPLRQCQIALRFLRAGYSHDGRCGAKQANHRTTTQRSIEKELAELDIREDRYLDLHLYARRAEVRLERDDVRRVGLEAIRAAKDDDTTLQNQNMGTDTGSEADILRWLEAELRDVWARSEGGTPVVLSTDLERHRNDLTGRDRP
jgi:hypothetical protein